MLRSFLSAARLTKRLSERLLEMPATFAAFVKPCRDDPWHAVSLLVGLLIHGMKQGFDVGVFFLVAKRGVDEPAGVAFRVP